MSKHAEKHDSVTFYREPRGDWRWRFRRGSNDKIMADGGEGYKNMSDAIYGAQHVLNCSQIELTGGTGIMFGPRDPVDVVIEDI